jgi:hypothetical protein
MAFVGEHGVTGVSARRAWRAARVRAHVLHHADSSLWHAPSVRRFVAIDEPEPHDPTEARAEILRRYLQAFGPASRRDIGAWSMMHVPEIGRALERLEPMRRFLDEQGESFSTSRERRYRTPKPRPPFASCRSGTTCCSPGRTEAEWSRSSTGRRSSA